jgi:hypothetical protein
LSLLFDDYAEDIMEALEEDVDVTLLQDRIKRGGELHECWIMLRVLLQAAYQGSVSEDEEENEGRGEVVGGGGGDEVQQILQTIDTIGETANVPQDRHATAKEVNVMEMYDHEHFSMVHAAAGVWECPAPLAKLVLKCVCTDGNINNSNTGGDNMGSRNSSGSALASRYSTDATDWDHNPIEAPTMDASDMEVMSNRVGVSEHSSDIDAMSRVGVSEHSSDMDGMSSTSNLVEVAVAGGETDLIRQRDEETMRLPLHIAVCARPQCREGYSTRLKVWLSSPEASRVNSSNALARQTSRVSVMSATGSLATHPDRGRSATSNSGAGQVYNPRFGRSPSSDSVVAYSSSQRRNNSSSFISRSGSNSSISANIAREPFLQHTMVRDVLNLYPLAVSVVDDRTGKLPIVLAIEHGKSWETAVGPLLDAYPTPFGGGGDGGMALPDDSPEGRGHRAALQAALFMALSSPETMPSSLDGIVSEWLDTMVKGQQQLETASAAAAAAGLSTSTPEEITVGPPGASSPSSSHHDWIQTQSSHLTAVAEVVSSSRPDSISDRVARLCLDTSREYLFSKDGNVREAAARVLGNTLNSVGDGDDAANVMREVVLNISNDDGSTCGSP